MKDAEGTIYRSNSFHVLANDTVTEVWNLHTGDSVELRGRQAATLRATIEGAARRGGTDAEITERTDARLSQCI